MLTWTKKKPDAVGWYWMRTLTRSGKRITDCPDMIQYVRKYGGKLCIQNWEIADHYLWAGPIQEPVSDCDAGVFDVYYPEEGGSE